ncbi:MAG: threonine synthase, partial [Alphaproteobacteria bacterium]
MEYISTRGQAPARDFEGVLLAGLAEDGGLFVPRHWPELSPAEWRAMRGLTYPELAARIIGLFAGSGLPLNTLCQEAYAVFGHPAIVPLVQLDPRCFALELF